MIKNILNHQILLKTAIRTAIAVTMVVSLVAVQDSSAHAGALKIAAMNGVGIQSGTRIVLRAPSASKLGLANNRSAEMRVLESRITSSGIAAATVQAKGDDEIVIELSSVQPNDPFIASLTAVGLMTFRYLPDVTVNDPGLPAAVRNRPVTIQMEIDPVTKEETCGFYDLRTRQSFRDGFHIRKDYASILAGGGKRAQVAADNRELTAWKKLLSSSKVIVTSKDLEPTSQAEMDRISAHPAVTQDFTPAGAAKMKDFTSKHMNTIMAILLDDRVLSAPLITGVIGNKGELSGGIPTLAYARNLAGIFNSGPLPVPLEVVSIERMGAVR